MGLVDRLKPIIDVMPFVEDESLRDRLDREKQTGVKDSVAIHGVTAASSLSPSRGNRARRQRPSGSRG